MQGTVVPFPDYTFYATSELIDSFTTAPGRLRQAIAGLTEDELRARARGPESWSIHEILLHMADSETQAALRFRKVWAGDPGPLAWHNQDLWSRTVDYQRHDAEARERALALIALARQQTLPLLARARDEDWAKRGTHPEFGDITLRNLLELYADHGERHLEQIVEIRNRLGRPLQMAPLLPRRLF